MKIAIRLLFGLFLFASGTNAQNLLTGKEILRANCKAIVQIYVGGQFSGVGFITSKDGIITTANHVVTTRDSKFRQYGSSIRVRIDGNPQLFDAAPTTPVISDDQVNYDSAMIKINFPADLPVVTLGTWKEVDVSDRLIIIPTWPGMGCMALEGIVANSVSAVTPFGPKPVSTILFQSPVRNGFSGSPIFSLRGNVIAIVDTKVYGISVALDGLRKQWTENQASISIGGADIGSSVKELINNLDMNLISGLGTGVAIDHSKQLQAAQNTDKK